MGENELDGRSCVRFETPGATVSYKKKTFFFSKGKYGEEFCPILDISRGGLRFLAQKDIKINKELNLKISIPGEKIPLVQKGKVRWCSFNVGKSYKYQIGIQFSPYGEKKGQNYPGNLTKIIALEQKYVPPEKRTKEKAGESKPKD
ncbi:MAG: PilZ domain-containing protein [Candidatus Aminicenantes bacterium]